MRINRTVLGWGVFLIVLGAVPLAANQGLVTEEAVSRLWTLWPVLLILAGIGLLLRRTPVSGVTDLAVSALFGLIAGGLLAGGAIPFASCGDERGSVAFPTESGDLGGTAAVRIDLACGDLTVAAGDGSAWSVEGVAEANEPPRISADASSLEVTSGREGPFGFDAKDRWTVTVPRDSALELVAEVNAGVGRFDLAGADLRSLEIDVNAGEVTIDLGGVTALGELQVEMNAVSNSRIILPDLSFSGSIEANAASGIRICPPSGAGLRLTVNDNITASNNYADHGLVRDGDVFETPGYDGAEVQIDLRTDVNAGGFELEAEGSCDA